MKRSVFFVIVLFYYSGLVGASEDGNKEPFFSIRSNNPTPFGRSVEFFDGSAIDYHDSGSIVTSLPDGTKIRETVKSKIIVLASGTKIFKDFKKNIKTSILPNGIKIEDFNNLNPQKDCHRHVQITLLSGTVVTKFNDGMTVIDIPCIGKKIINTDGSTRWKWYKKVSFNLCYDHCDKNSFAWRKAMQGRLKLKKALKN